LPLWAGPGNASLTKIGKDLNALRAPETNSSGGRDLYETGGVRRRVKWAKHMASIDADVSDAEAGEDGPAKRKLSGKVLILYIALPLVLLIGAGVGVYMSGLLGSHEPEKPVIAVPVFYDLPDFLVNLSGPAPQHFLKMKVALQITDAEAAKRLDAELPRVLDAFQVFLRELRPEDVEGSAGMLRVKEELLRRINLAVQPPLATDILFKEVIVQ
jgi:flagellar FliL protein